ncbi:MAG: hypothetical protein AAB440_00055 [Patescibacteria group bacterium]
MSQEDGKGQPSHPDVLPIGTSSPPRPGEVIGGGEHPHIVVSGFSAPKHAHTSPLDSMNSREERREFLDAMRAAGKTQEELVQMYRISAADEAFYFAFKEKKMAVESIETSVRTKEEEATRVPMKTRSPGRPPTPRTLKGEAREEPYYWPDCTYDYYLPSGGKTRGALTREEYIRAWEEARFPWRRPPFPKKPDHFPSMEQALKAKIKP